MYLYFCIDPNRIPYPTQNPQTQPKPRPQSIHKNISQPLI